MKTFRTNVSQHGFTLIEMMIALLIGVFLLIGVVQIFSSAKQAYRLQENLSRLQENGRFAMDFITKDIRMVGYVGCSSKVIPNSILDPAKISIPYLTAGLNGVDGVNVTTSSWNGVANTKACGTSPANQCVAGTDVISIQSANSCGTKLVTDVDNSAQFQITTPNTCGLAQDGIAIIASCTNVDIFALSNNPGDGSVAGNGKQTIAHGVGNSLNCVAKLGYKCDNTPKDNHSLSVNYSKNETEILAPRLYSYYIRTNPGGIPSLYRLDDTKAASSTNPVELIEGIENMQILYGVDTDDPQDFVPNYYVDATKVTNWTGTPPNVVVSVRISLLAQTIDNGLTFSTESDGTKTSQPYFYNGSKITPPDTDRRIRRVFSSTIAVRNRLP